MPVLLAPGQGAQTPGFLTPWLEDATSRAQLGSWSKLIGLDLIHLGTVADSDEIRETSHCLSVEASRKRVADGHRF